MDKFSKKIEFVEAKQWFKDGDLDVVKKHVDCDYRGCPVCGGDAKTEPMYVINSYGRFLYIKSGDWIVKDGNNYNSYNTETFNKLFDKA